MYKNDVYHRIDSIILILIFVNALNYYDYRTIRKCLVVHISYYGCTKYKRMYIQNYNSGSIAYNG